MEGLQQRSCYYPLAQTMRPLTWHQEATVNPCTTCVCIMSSGTLCGRTVVQRPMDGFIAVSARLVDEAHRMLSCCNRSKQQLGATCSHPTERLGTYVQALPLHPRLMSAHSDGTLLRLSVPSSRAQQMELACLLACLIARSLARSLACLLACLLAFNFSFFCQF